ncbi:MAG: NADH-quinone oxidoreductase subunit NuoF [Ilumatobacter sp.]|mgnify:FL=1|jgi:NADH-quinone oxidoreductase subunit F|uniref:NADH-quinone oxidoreductase subunit NuoF n=1 Tax=Ilumatobacter sp. TaxID=1967498 RepID=UPI001D2697AB|nr:NADH-quinone oxidoreductase subunit NuoF [Ilumatobacter sp.]MBT5276863.1 NADH-quinone oxidoreductase subunit NuoF [Ilumatobacter sp.]MBT5554246.1 NADH-quinone oxidoreductase subunit NuoF [Ilumatobacter sp.]MBT5867141.1 NADH-quinone oxidoreductase subunit NuoF [Ilumatobacter sp.]MBT7428980.1 NADH-quinone oxidoreductase subunit NuoF [Ilumatobacter sp.]
MSTTNSPGAVTHDYIPGFYIGDRPKVVTSRFEYEDSHTLERFLATDGYNGLKKCLAMSPQEMHDEVRNSTVLGRGGAGFPAGVKWGFTPQGVWPRYLVVNGDESEPGTYKDRLLMERDPHQLIEGCLIACYAAGLSQCFLYVRGEMALAQERIAVALNDAYAAGYIGKNILGTDFSVDIVLHWGAGAYVVGEETALIESLEGERGMPRLKPPFFPAAVGLYGKPTIVNNVETLANLPFVALNGSAAYTAIGTPTSPGTRMVAVSGHVKRPGVYEIINGSTTFRDIIYGDEFSQGIRDDNDLKAFVPGGGSAPWFVEDQLDIPFEGKEAGAAGSMLGSGAIMVMDSTTDIPHAAYTLTKFYAHESCGKCTPCREGGTWLMRMLERVIAGYGTDADLDQMREVGQTICPGDMPHASSKRLDLEAVPFPYKMTTICFVGPSAWAPLHSALTLFPEEFEAIVTKVPKRVSIPVTALSGADA